MASPRDTVGRRPADVPGSLTRSPRRLGEEVAAHGGTLLVVDDTIAAARHAAERGWIAPDALPGIGAAAAAGDRAP